jgi:hypothetical protein
VTDTYGHHGTPPTIPPTDAAPVRKWALIALAVGAGVYFVCGAINGRLQDFFLTYLVGYLFWFSIPFGALGLTMIGYLTSASWGVVFRRYFQAAIRTLPLVAAFFLPIAVSLFLDHGKASPFWWADESWFVPHEPPEGAERNEYTKTVNRFVEDGWDKEIAEVAASKGTRPEAVEENHHKVHDYLNKPFFLARAVGYFVVLGTLAFFVLKWTKRVEERDDPEARSNLRGFCGPGVIAWAIFTTFAITDWAMSVEPTWASSMFPVVFGMNAFMCTFSLGIIVFYGLNAGKTEVMTVFKDKFRIDIGTLLLGFTMVWAYATFCQYMLIWAGNLPEEITYYRKRGDHGWQYLAYALMAFHWLTPFVILLFREVKTDPVRIRMVAGLLLCVGAADVVWWIVPSIPHPDGGLYVPMAFGAILMLGGAWGLLFAKYLGEKPMLPRNQESAFLANWGHHNGHHGHADAPQGAH